MMVSFKTPPSLIDTKLELCRHNWRTTDMTLAADLCIKSTPTNQPSCLSSSLTCPVLSKSIYYYCADKKPILSRKPPQKRAPLTTTRIARAVLVASSAGTLFVLPCGNMGQYHIPCMRKGLLNRLKRPIRFHGRYARRVR